MTETPQPLPHPWLPTDANLEWLQLDPSSPLVSVAEWCRRAAAKHCERQRRDLVDAAGTFAVDPDADADIVLAGLIASARLYARRVTPAGLASFGEFGAAAVLRLDPDVARLLGTGRYAAPRVG